MADPRIVISTEAAVNPRDVAYRSFATAFRGFDQQEVRNFLRRVGEELVSAQQRETELRRVIEDLRRPIEPPALDEEALTTALGEEAARVLHTAKEAAADIRAKAEDKAARLLLEVEEKGARLVREADARATRMRADAEGVMAERTEEAEAAAAAIRRGAEAEGEAMRAQAHAESAAELEAARDRGRAMVAEAQALRERVLSDLLRRRTIARAQIEQLRAGRERLLDAYRLVRRTAEEATEELSVAEAEARLAAEAAARRAASAPEGTVEELEADLTAARRAELPLVEPSSAWMPRPAERTEPERDREPEGSREPAEPVLAGTGATVSFEAAARPAAATALPAAEPATVPTAAAPAPAAGSDHPAPAPATVPTAAATTPAAMPDQPGPAPAAGSDQPAPAPAGPDPRSLAPGAVPVPPPLTPVSTAVASSAPASGSTPAATTAPSDGVRLLKAARLEEPPVSLPALPAEPGVSGAGVPGAGAPAAEAGAVDDLFARLKADRARVVAHARDVLHDAAEADSGGKPAAVPNAAGDGARVAEADEAILQRRDELLEPIEQQLSRRLKRTLQDEQNELLDSLRTRREEGSALPPAEEHMRRYRSVVSPLLAEAARHGAGSTEAGEVEEDAIAAAADDLSGDLSIELIGPLRERLESALAELAHSSDPQAAAELLGSGYRQWKAQRVEGLARHHAASAFTRGAFAATPSGRRLRWLVDDDGDGCADCDDNALAGPTPKSEEFPTGQRLPPAHPGCRCLLVPE